MTDGQVEQLAKEIFAGIQGRSMGFEELAKLLDKSLNPLAIKYNYEFGTAIFEDQNDSNKFFAKGFDFRKLADNEGNVGVSTLRSLKGFNLAGNWHTHGRNGTISDFSEFSRHDMLNMLERTSSVPTHRGGFLSSTNGKLFFFDGRKFEKALSSGKIGPFTTIDQGILSARMGFINEVK